MKRFLLILALCACATVSSCLKQPAEPVVPSTEFPEGQQVTISFSMILQGLSGVATKALGEEESLNTLHLAVFGSSGYLKEYVKATPVPDIGEPEYYTYDDPQGVSRTCRIYKFSAKLTLTDSRRTIHFIGNGPETLSFGYADAVLPPVLSENGEQAYWSMITVTGIRAVRYEGEPEIRNGVQVLPGDYIDAQGNKITNNTGYIPDETTLDAFKRIPLIRNWARIVIEADKRVDPDTGLENESFFEPYSYAVVNVPSMGTVAPHSSATGFIGDYYQKTFYQLEGHYPANLPPGTTFNKFIPSKEDFLQFRNGVAGYSGNVPKAVYLYERPVPSEQIPSTYILVYGHYKNPDDLSNEGDYFYKIDLMVGDKYYPVFRNFEYTILIKKILSKGHQTPAAAAAAAGSADVSADINASHLSDISDGYARLVIQPWMSKTLTKQVTDFKELSALFIDDVQTGTFGENVTVEKRPMDYGEDVITALSIGEPSTIAGSEGWRTITFSTSEPSNVVRSQTIRVTGDYGNGRLYRDIVITLQPIQDMRLSCQQGAVFQEKGAPMTLDISIPDGFAESMFPLQFIIEPEKMTLTPDDSQANNNLPVESGLSISDNPEYKDKPSFHFIRTLDWEEYTHLKAVHDEEDNSTWRTLTCYFKSNRDVSATTIWVSNTKESEYFNKNSLSFTNYEIKTFRRLKFTQPIRREEEYPLSVTFDIDADLPLISLTPIGMVPVTDGVQPGPTGTYYYQPTSTQVQLDFITTTNDGRLRLSLTADAYESQTLNSHFFTNFGFVDGHKLSDNKMMSNVMRGFVNSASGKTVLFGYCDDSDALNPTITLKNPPAGLSATKPTKFPWTPTEPRSPDGDQTYHEIEFKTTSTAIGDPVSFTLSAPGYIEEEVSAHRFEGNIYTQVIGTGDYLKPSSGSFQEDLDNWSFTLKIGDSGKNCTVTFDHVSELRSSEPKGVMLDAGGTYHVTLDSADDEYRLFYVQFDIKTDYKWQGNVVDLGPVIDPANLNFFKYRGAKNQYIWLINGEKSATLTLHASDDHPIVITGMTIKTFRGRTL